MKAKKAPSDSPMPVPGVEEVEAAFHFLRIKLASSRNPRPALA